MKLTILFCCLFFTVTAIAQLNNVNKFENSSNTGIDSVGYLSVIKDSSGQKQELIFSNTRPEMLLDTISKYTNSKIRFEKGKMPPLKCNGSFDLKSDLGAYLKAICNNYNLILREVNKKSFRIELAKIELADIFDKYEYKTEINPHNKYIEKQFDTVRKTFVLSFKGVSPYDLFKKHADYNGYSILFTEPLKPLTSVSGILPLFLEQNVLVEHFIQVHNLYQFEDEETNKIVISSTQPKK